MLGRPALGHQWAILSSLVIIISLASSGQAKPYEFHEKICTDSANCTSYPGSKCLMTNTTNVSKCGCDNGNGFKLTGNTCRVEVEISAKCNDLFAFCKQEKSECRHAGDLSSDRRCKCVQDYVGVRNNGTIQCAKVLTKQDNSNCSTCYDNEGICYEFFDKSRKCLCPVSRIGAECEKILVHVSCQRYQLDICYEPHPDVNLTQASMFTHSHAQLSTCRARLTTTNTTFCPAGRLQLTLDLNNNELERCGVKRMTFDADYIRYVAMVDVSRSKADIKPYMFKTYCEYQFKQDAQIEVAVIALNENDRGKKKKVPTATLR